MDYKVLFEAELLKVEPKYRQGILSGIAEFEFEVESFSYAELYDALKEANDQIALEKENIKITA